MILIDSSIWSLALRRRPDALSEHEQNLVEEWTRLVRRGQAALIGPIRQEILSGIRVEKAFETLREILDDFRYLEIEAQDYDTAAIFFNRCRAKGISATPIDLLICAVANRFELPIFTVDSDFRFCAPYVGIVLHRVQEVQASGTAP